MGNLIKTAFGNDRSAHAVNIALHANNWAEYEKIHKDVFAENNLRKYHVVDSSGKLIANADDALELVHHTNGTVRHEDFLVIRDMVVEVRRRDLTGINDLKAAGLTFNADIGDQLVGFEVISEFTEAQQEMNPQNFDNNDIVYTEDFVPNPITHSTFNVPWRQQGFNYKRSAGLAESLRQTAERLEETLFNGNSNIAVSYNGSNSTIYGYTTDPNRGTGTITDWTLNATNRDLIVSEVITQVGAMYSDQGGVANDSVVLYVSNDFWTIFQNDYVDGQPSKTILARLRDIAAIKDVKPAEKLASKSAVLVEMRSRAVELAIASDIIVTPHTKTNPMQPQAMTTYAAMVQKIKADANGNTGVRHLTI
jgi:hypothetical protein